MRTDSSFGPIAAILLATTTMLACPGKPLPGDDDVDTGSESGTASDTGTGTGTSETGTSETGTGETGTGDTSTDTGNLDCPPAPVPADFAYSYQVNVDGAPFSGVLDEACTLSGILGGELLLELDCPGGQVQLLLEATPLPVVDGTVGEPAHLWMVSGGLDGRTWLRVDFPDQDLSLFVIDGAPLAPSANEFYSPPPWNLAVVDDCGPLDDGCVVTRPQQLQVDWQDQSLAVWSGSYGAINAGDVGLEMWVGRADEIVATAPGCDPTPDFFNTHRVLIRSTGRPVEGDVCQPGESEPCATGLHCCYPCGVPDCDYLCTPEDAESMQCPPPPP